MVNYKLLTPGPLTTSQRVKEAMMVDHCTWDNDYKSITQKIRASLLDLAHVDDKTYTCILMQGSGTFGVESILTSAIGKEDKILILSNGAYGDRMGKIASQAGLNHRLLSFAYDQSPCPESVEKALEEDPAISHVAMVHCETTSGILNDIEAVGKKVKSLGKTFIVDAMSSFGGVDIEVEKLGIDFIISSANKCIQGVPGFSFIICKTDLLEKCQGQAPSLSLDLYDQWKEMDKDGKWRFTSPTHVVLAFDQALEELKEEGGIPARQKRYEENNRILIEGMNALGFESYIKRELQSPIITTFFYPQIGDFSFEEMYNFIKERGYAIYPGKLTDADVFRVGNIGEIYKEDMKKLCQIFEDFLASKK